MKVTKRAAAVAVGTTVAVAAGGAAYASSTGGASGTPAVGAAAPNAASSAAPAAHGHGRAGARAGLGRGLGVGGRVLHGEVVVQTRKGPQTVDIQRGVVTAASATSLTVRSPDGVTWTYTLDAKTRVRKQRAAAKPGDIATGDHVGVLSQPATGGARTARIVRDAGSAPDRASGSAGSGG